MRRQRELDWTKVGAQWGATGCRLRAFAWPGSLRREDLAPKAAQTRAASGFLARADPSVGRVWLVRRGPRAWDGR